MKRVIKIIFLMSVLLFFSFNAYAIEMVINVKGTVINNTSDDLGWGGEPFAILYTIDSDKSPYFSDIDDTIVGNFFSVDAYYPDSVDFTVGGANQSIGEARLQFVKFESYGKDFVDVQVANSTNDWFLYVSLELSYCNLGSPSIPASTLFNLDDGSIGTASILAGPFGFPTGTLYNLSVTDFKSNPVPEPTTMLLFGAGLVGLAGFGRKKFKK